MNTLQLPFNFHDAVVVTCDIRNKNSLELVVMLYEVNYPNKEYVRLTFLDVFNIEKLTRYVEQVNEDALEQNWNGTRINNIAINRKQPSNNLSQHFTLDMDGFKTIKIHCSNFKIEKVDHYE